VGGQLAAAFAFASAATSAYWLFGGTALLDTVGGSIERLARDRSIAALAGGAVTVMAKVIGGVLALWVVRSRSRRLATFAAAVGWLLALYGAVLTVVGGLALLGVFGSAGERPANERALRWHVMLWDPWFLVWGVALAVAGMSVRRRLSSGGNR
jgi:hypothetical protein